MAQLIDTFAPGREDFNTLMSLLMAKQARDRQNKLDEARLAEDAQQRQMRTMQMADMQDQTARRKQADLQTQAIEQAPQLKPGWDTQGPTLAQVETTMADPNNYLPPPDIAPVSGMPSSVPGGAPLPPIKPIPTWVAEAKQRFEQEKQRKILLQQERDKTLAGTLKPGEVAPAIPLINAPEVKGPSKDLLEMVNVDVGNGKIMQMPKSSAEAWYKDKIVPNADVEYRNQLEKEYIAKGMTQEAAHKKAYEKQKLMVPSTIANIRLEGYSQSRLYAVYDKTRNETRKVSAEELNRAEKEEPGRYTDPAYTPEAITSRDTAKYFSAGGKGGQKVISYNTALAHLNLFDQMADALHNGDVQKFNQLGNWFTEQTGNPAPTNFDSTKAVMETEIANVLSSVSATIPEIEKVSRTVENAESPSQLHEAADTYRSLLASKKDQMQAIYKAGIKGESAFTVPTPTKGSGNEKPATSAGGGSMKKAEDVIAAHPEWGIK